MARHLFSRVPASAVTVGVGFLGGFAFWTLLQLTAPHLAGNIVAPGTRHPPREKPEAAVGTEPPPGVPRTLAPRDAEKHPRQECPPVVADHTSTKFSIPEPVSARPGFAAGLLDEVQAPPTIEDISPGCSRYTYDRLEWTVTFQSIPPGWTGLWTEPDGCEQVTGKRPMREIVHRYVYAWNNTWRWTDDACPTDVEEECYREQWRWCVGVTADDARSLAKPLFPLDHLPTPTGDGSRNVRMGRAPCCRERIASVLRHLAKELDRRDVRWFLEAGSALGALREGRQVRYDFDYDLLVDYQHRAQFYKAVGVVSAKTGAYIMVDGSTPRIDASTIGVHNRRIEFWFYKLEGGNLVVPSSVVNKRRESEVFPVRRVLFEGAMMPVANKYEELMARDYGPSHMTEFSCTPEPGH